MAVPLRSNAGALVLLCVAIGVAVQPPAAADQEEQLPEPIEIAVTIVRPELPSLPAPFEIRAIVRRPNLPQLPSPLTIQVTVERPALPELSEPLSIAVVVQRPQIPPPPEPFALLVLVERPAIPAVPAPFTVEVRVGRPAIPALPSPFEIGITISREAPLPAERLGEILQELDTLAGEAQEDRSELIAECARSGLLLEQAQEAIETLALETESAESELQMRTEARPEQDSSGAAQRLLTEAQLASEELALLRDRAGSLRTAACDASSRSTDISSLSAQATTQMTAVRQARDGLDRLAREGSGAGDSTSDLRSRVDQTWSRVGEIGQGLDELGEELARSQGRIDSLETRLEQGSELLAQGLDLSAGDADWESRLTAAFDPLEISTTSVGSCPEDETQALAALRGDLQSVGSRIEALLEVLETRSNNRAEGQVADALAEADSLLSVSELLLESITNRLAEAETCTAAAPTADWGGGTFDADSSARAGSGWQSGTLVDACHTPPEARGAIEAALGRLQAAAARPDRYTELLSAVDALVTAAAMPGVCEEDKNRVRTVLDSLQQAQAAQLEQADAATADALARGRQTQARRQQAWDSAMTSIAGALIGLQRAAAEPQPPSNPGGGGNSSAAAGSGSTGNDSRCVAIQQEVQRKVSEWQSLLSRRPANDRDGAWCQEVIAWNREFVTWLRQAESIGCVEVTGPNARPMLDQMRTMSGAVSCEN